MTSQELAGARNMVINACNRADSALEVFKRILDRQAIKAARNAISEAEGLTSLCGDYEQDAWKVIAQSTNAVTAVDSCGASAAQVVIRWLYDPNFDPDVEFELANLLDKCVAFNTELLCEIISRKNPNFSWRQFETKNSNLESVITDACKAKSKSALSEESHDRFVRYDVPSDLQDGETRFKMLTTPARWVATFRPFEKFAIGMMNLTLAYIRFHALKQHKLALSYYDSQNYAQAACEASVAARMDWGLREAHLLAAVSSARNNNRDEATLHCKACLKQRPDDPEARQILAQILRG